ncbi:HAD family hydrolase [Rhodocaloribacter litoris]|uniref:HAD family hydrolase n=1 Tax=Rhodocaloribacter litoris TaxID=2558931 RepID=UPI001420C71F|nr:HAD family hydrolase [Rhodocaloribacter litoris]QXD16583.1 HAD family hydrolase [Rhodocaloribacter litoris]
MAFSGALTIDFWNTLVEAGVNGAARRQQRMTHLLATVHACRPGILPAHVEAAFNEAVRRFDQAWKHQHRTPCTEELVRDVWNLLDLQVPPDRHEDTVRVFQEGVLEHPPALVEGAAETLDRLAERYRLALISDTMFSPGRVLRRLLDRHGLLRYFDAFVFSDETSFSKPDVRAFHQAARQLNVSPGALLHIGDLRRTDVAGARQAGACAVLFTGVHTDEEEGPEPHHILTCWHELPDLLRTRFA